MKSIELFLCATIVFVAYAKLGYYRPLGLVKAIRAYHREKRRLQADVLVIKKFGLPIGTLMCSVDRGECPVDDVFPEQMAELRLKYGGRLAYFGKFGVIPTFQKCLAGYNLMYQAATSWSPLHQVDAVTMMVNPNHVKIYIGLGAEVLAATDGTVGLEKAPAVLMVLEYTPAVLDILTKKLAPAADRRAVTA